MPSDITQLAQQIKHGTVGVMPTDTIYGVVASVYCPESIERIYDCKLRPKDKPMIVLAASIEQIKSLGVVVTGTQYNALDLVWPGPVSIILPHPNSSFAYLHRGTKTLAVRVPEPAWLRDLLAQTGPIVATSANPSGESPDQDIQQIMQRLPGLDFYIPGTVGVAPSMLGRLQHDGAIEWLRR